MINSKNYPEKSPEWTLARFFEAWEKRNWTMMLKYCQLSWVKRPFVYSTDVSFLDIAKAYKQFVAVDVEKIIATQFRHKLISAKILKTEKISDATSDISVEIYYKDINIKKRIKRKVRLICEIAPMQPSIDGSWGVNPTSMIKARR